MRPLPNKAVSGRRESKPSRIINHFRLVYYGQFRLICSVNRFNWKIAKPAHILQFWHHSKCTPYTLFTLSWYIHVYKFE